MVAALLILSTILLLICIGGGSYLLIVLPRRWSEPLNEALALIDSDDRDDLERADRLLSEALSHGPRRQRAYEAKFAQAFVRAMLGRYDAARYGAAAAIVEELTAISGYDSATAYLDLWLQSRLENHQRVCDIFDQHRDLLSERPESRKIVAVSSLRLASEHWRRHEVDGALHYFDKLRELGELTDRIPPGVDNLQLVKGVQALFDHRTEEARNAFTSARQRLESRGMPSAEPQLGLVACDWAAGDPGDLAHGLASIAAQLDQYPAESEGYQLRGPVAVLRLNTLLRDWAAQSDNSPATVASYRRELDRLVMTARQIDDCIGDVHLIDGLIRYYFAADPGDRERALKDLDHATTTANGIVLPELIELLQQERSIGGRDNAMVRLFELINELLRDPDQAAEYRAKYLRLSERLQAVVDPGLIAAEIEPNPATPVEEDRDRAEAFRRRIELILYPYIRDHGPDSPLVGELRSLLAVFESSAASHAAAAHDLQAAENGVLTGLVAILLPEDDVE